MSSVGAGNEPVRAEQHGESGRSANVYPLAVIELGTSAIRMAIGQTDGVNGVQVLEQLIRGGNAGKRHIYESRDSQKNGSGVYSGSEKLSPQAKRVSVYRHRKHSGCGNQCCA